MVKVFLVFTGGWNVAGSQGFKMTQELISPAYRLSSDATKFMNSHMKRTFGKDIWKNRTKNKAGMWILENYSKSYYFYEVTWVKVL